MLTGILLVTAVTLGGLRAICIAGSITVGNIVGEAVTQSGIHIRNSLSRCAADCTGACHGAVRVTSSIVVGSILELALVNKDDPVDIICGQISLILAGNIAGDLHGQVDINRFTLQRIQAGNFGLDLKFHSFKQPDILVAVLFNGYHIVKLIHVVGAVSNDIILGQFTDHSADGYANIAAIIISAGPNTHGNGQFIVQSPVLINILICNATSCVRRGQIMQGSPSACCIRIKHKAITICIQCSVAIYMLMGIIDGSQLLGNLIPDGEGAGGATAVITGSGLGGSVAVFYISRELMGHLASFIRRCDL